MNDSLILLVVIPIDPPHKFGMTADVYGFAASSYTFLGPKYRCRAKIQESGVSDNRVFRVLLLDLVNYVTSMLELRQML